MSVKTKRIMFWGGVVVYVILHMVPMWTQGINATLLFGWWPLELFYRVCLMFVGGVLFAWLLTRWGMPKDASEAIKPVEAEKSKGGAK